MLSHYKPFRYLTGTLHLAFDADAFPDHRLTTPNKIHENKKKKTIGLRKIDPDAIHK